MTKPTAKGTRITGTARATMARRMANAYEAGNSIRDIAASYSRSYGTVHTMLREEGVALRHRGGRR